MVGTCGVINILLRHAERFRIVLAAGTAQRFGIAPGIQTMLALVNGPDILHRRCRHHFNMLIGTTWTNHLFLLIGGCQHRGQFFSPGFGFRQILYRLAIVAAVVRRNRRGGIDNQFVGDPAGLEPGSSSSTDMFGSCTRSPPGYLR
jgi:hypothetical protein